MGFENIQESISNKNNTGIKNLRQGLVYNRNKKKTKKNVMEGFKEGMDVSKYKASGEPTKPWLSSGPYNVEGSTPGDKGVIYRHVGSTKRRLKEKEKPTDPDQYEEYRDQVRNYKGMFDDMRAKEFAEFEGALKKFNSAKTSYKSQYDIVADKYTGIEDNVTKCKSNCLNEIESVTTDRNGMSADAYKAMYQKFCQAGCTFNGPQLVNSCKDNWKGLKNKEKDSNNNTYSVGATCSAFHPVCDKNNNMIMRNQHDNEVLSYKDTRGTLLKDGCCSCGGGSGGPPMYANEGIFHKSCDSLKLQACGPDGRKCGNSASAFINKCNSPPMPQTGNSDSNSTLKEKLKKAYDNVVTNNNVMRDRGEYLFNKINTYDKQLNSLNNEKNNEEETYDEIISNYKKSRKELQKMYGIDDTVAAGANDNPNDLYSKIMENKLKMSKDWTRDVMVEESKLRRQSEEMKFWMWSILAIVVGWATIINFRKKVA